MLPATIDTNVYNNLFQRDFSYFDIEIGGCPLSYHLDCAVDFGYIAVDTYAYASMIQADMNFLNAQYDPRTVTDPYERHMRDGQFNENNYIKWRHENPSLRKYISAYAVVNNNHNFHASMLLRQVKLLCNTQNALTIGDLREHIDQYDDKIAMYHRARNRIREDLKGYSKQEIEQMASYIDAYQNELRQENYPWMLAGEDIPVLPKIKTKEERSIIKKSIKILSKFIGTEKTRLFFSGTAICITGKYAVYEITKKPYHGGDCLLSAYSKKDNRIHLFDICIYTQGVPLADHVVSLIMHIQSGEEGTLLTTGNFFNINHVEPWMEDFKPKRALVTEDRAALIAMVMGLPENKPKILKRKVANYNKARLKLTRQIAKTICV